MKSAISLVILFVVMAVLIVHYFSIDGITQANSPQDPQSPGYVEYTLILYNNTLVKGNYVPPVTSDLDPTCIAFDPSNGYLYVAISGSNTVSVINPKIIL